MSASFEAAHSLKGDFGPAQRLHGHTYRVDVTISGPQIDRSGALLDVGLVRSAVESVIGPLHLQSLDTVPELRDINTTVEALAEYIHQRLRDALTTDSALRLGVRVWESPTVWGGYEGPLG
jgi:6-pyruvoyltetrahydropterin/6-carboxytetrahydropterin synthase